MNFSLSTPRKIFVTGASGFIGSTVIRKLLRRGHKVTGFCRSEKLTLPPGCTYAAEELFDHPNFTHFQGDILSLDDLRQGMSGCEAVIHLAGYAKNYSPDASVYEKINVGKMRNVFNAAKELKIEKIVWTSSIVTFGPTPRKTVGDENLERITNRYYTEYEASKAKAEKEALQYVHGGLPVVIVNPTRVYGPGMMSEGNSTTLIIDDYMHGRMPFLIKFGINIGNYGFVDDVAEGHILALENGRIGERYILGGDNASLKDLFKRIDKASGRRHIKIPIATVFPYLFAYSQLWFARWFGVYPCITPGWISTFLTDWAYSCQKAKDELGYSPISLDEGLVKTCRWLKEIR